MDVIGRAKRLLLEPQTEWRVIARENDGAAGLFTGYVAVLALVPAVCGLIGSLLIGAPILSSLTFAVVSYLCTFVAVGAEALLIDALAPVFGSRRNLANAVKLAVFFPTAYWVMAIFFAVPVLSILALVGLYSFYLLWVGLPVLMPVPAERAAAYVASAAIGAIVFAAICLTIAARISGVALI
jgi:hypothetical protein